MVTTIPTRRSPISSFALVVVLFLAGCSDTPEVESFEAGKWTNLMAEFDGEDVRVCLDTSFVLTSYAGQCAFNDPEINVTLVGDEVPRLIAALPKPGWGFRGFSGEFTAKHVHGKWELTGFQNLVFPTPPVSS